MANNGNSKIVGPEDGKVVLALTERHPVSAYDAEYVSLAMDLAGIIGDC